MSSTTLGGSAIGHGALGGGAIDSATSGVAASGAARSTGTASGSTVARRPWYREIWPWLLMLPPLASVIAGSTILYLALHSPADLVVNDYARIEEITDERFVRDARAAALGLTATVDVGPREGGDTTVEVTLDGLHGPPPWLKVELEHVARRDADVELRLSAAADGGGRYEGEGRLAPGQYAVEVSPPDDAWRLAGTIPRGTTELELRPQRTPGP